MDDYSAAEPDGMPVAHLKLLVRPRAGETLENSGLSFLHDFVSLLTRGAISVKAAKFHERATLFA